MQPISTVIQCSGCLSQCWEFFLQCCLSWPWSDFSWGVGTESFARCHLASVSAYLGSRLPNSDQGQNSWVWDTRMHSRWSHTLADFPSMCYDLSLCRTLAAEFCIHTNRNGSWMCSLLFTCNLMGLWRILGKDKPVVITHLALFFFPVLLKEIHLSWVIYQGYETDFIPFPHWPCSHGSGWWWVS